MTRATEIDCCQFSVGPPQIHAARHPASLEHPVGDASGLEKVESAWINPEGFGVSSGFAG